jgi:hypothetical protein
MARSRRRTARDGPARASREPDASETLARAIASLDAEFERITPANAAARAEYDERRRALKRELTSALDSHSRST